MSHNKITQGKSLNYKGTLRKLVLRPALTRDNLALYIINNKITNFTCIHL